MTKSKNEYRNFTNLANRLLGVPHSEIKAKLEAERKDKGQRKKGKKAKA